jgi:hypothetical protein
MGKKNEIEKSLLEYRDSVIENERDRMIGILNQARARFLGLDEAIECIDWIDERVYEED